MAALGQSLPYPTASCVIRMHWPVLAPETDATRLEKPTTETEGRHSLDHHHHQHCHYHHHSEHQQLNGSMSQAAAPRQVYGHGVSGEKTHSASAELFRETETHQRQHRPRTAVTDKHKVMYVSLTADSQVLRNDPSTLVETSDRWLTNGDVRPVASSMSASPSQNRQHAFVPFIYRASSALAEVRQPRPHPAIAVIQLSGQSVGDRVVYQDPPNSGRGPPRSGHETVRTDDRRRPPPATAHPSAAAAATTTTTTSTTRRQTSATINGGGRQQVLV